MLNKYHYSCVQDKMEKGKKGGEVKKDPEPENHLGFWLSIPDKSDKFGQL